MGIFNIRVYGILINEGDEVLVTDELIRELKITKFPGGGLEFGEGTRDCLRREFMEEMNLKVDVGDHIYTTDFYQESAFRPGDQIISIYYYVHPLEDLSVRISTMPFEFSEGQMKIYQLHHETESFRFIPRKELSADSVSLPIDKIVAEMVSGRR
jgi:ADP-ribose pyrophosphatase YjhB (NUDIX family)